VAEDHPMGEQPDIEQGPSLEISQEREALEQELEALRWENEILRRESEILRQKLGM